MRYVPEDNLAYPVLVKLSTGGTGSAFFVQSAKNVFLVTAQHVLYDQNTRKLLAPSAELVCYSRVATDSIPNRFEIDLSSLDRSGELVSHSARDVVVLRFGSRTEEGGRSVVKFASGVRPTESSPNGITCVSIENIKVFADVFVANEVVVFGYPTSLGLKSIPQLDLNRPLLRRGIVAGLNLASKSIVLDCSVYPGNSGGIVIEIESEGFERRYRAVGVVSQFVPYAEVWYNTSHGHTNTSISNSGYSIAVPMDFVLELVEHIENS